MPTTDASPGSPAVGSEALPETDLERAAQRVRQLEQEALDMHDLAQRLNKEGRFQEAQAAYSAMHRLEDEASALAAKVGCVACVLGDAGQDASGQPALCNMDPAELLPYQCLHPALSWRPRAPSPSSPPSTPAVACAPAPAPVSPPAAAEVAVSAKDPAAAAAAAAMSRRCVGAVLGSALADAAAMGVHWVYDLGALEHLEAERRASAAAAAADTPPQHPYAFGLEFMEPPRSPFYAYATGRNSPYGEQTLALLRSLAETGGLDARHYADAFAAAFGPGFEGYRDVSTKGFLRNYGRGLPPPLSGANDAQANCIARLAPLVAAFAEPPPPPPCCPPGDPGDRNAGGAAASACARAGAGAAAVPAAPAADEAAGPSGRAGGAAVGGLLYCVELATRVTQNTDAAVAWACVGAAVLEAVVLGASAEAAVRGVLADLESPQGRLAPYCRGPSPPELAAQLARCMALAGTPVAEAVAELGRNCHMPNALTTPLQVVLHVERMAAAAAAADGGSGGGAEAGGEGRAPWSVLPAEAYVWGVRLAVREGGCCASRAAYVGACLGAMVARGGASTAAAAAGGSGAGDAALPAEWLARYPAAGRVREWAEALVAARS